MEPALISVCVCSASLAASIIAFVALTQAFQNWDPIAVTVDAMALHEKRSTAAMIGLMGSSGLALLVSIVVWLAQQQTI